MFSQSDPMRTPSETGCQLYLSEKVVNYAPMVLGHFIQSTDPASTLKLSTTSSTSYLVTVSGVKFLKTTAILRYLARVYVPEWYELHHGRPHPEKATTIDAFLHEVLHGHSDVFQQELTKMNDYLKFRSFMVGYQWSLADLYLWGALKAIPSFQEALGQSTVSQFPYLVRWYFSIENLFFVQQALHSREHLIHLRPPFVPSMANQTPKDTNKNRSTAAHDPMDIVLPKAEMGHVVTRFPPEPSGYMHIGHAKAAMLNSFFADKYQGELIFRLDDTNPEKEQVEYEEAIREDLRMLGIQFHRESRTSDYFEPLLEYAEQLIRQGDAYVDDTDVDTMRKERMQGIASQHRERDVESNLLDFEEMKEGTERGLACCLRAKIDHTNPNKALRDPVLYRCQLTPHHHTGSRFRVYPTYDFACPVVDSIEGVTHALRTNEYRDRNPQYHWVQTKLGLREVFIWDFSRLNFVYTLLSKRKLAWFVDSGNVPGWDDPRFPTVRGLLRRGLTVSALREFILLQGASTKTMLLEWDKLWSLNKKKLDPVAPRHTAIEQPIHVYVVGEKFTPHTKEILKHKKNPDLGTKFTWYSSHLIIEARDTVGLKIGEEVTLMDWGNAIVMEIAAHHLRVRLNLAGDVKSTARKWTWLSFEHTLRVQLKDYDYLITKKKLDPNDDFHDYLTTCSEFTSHALADLNLSALAIGTHVQFERKGFYILDAQLDDVLLFNAIPDGRAASVALKHGAPIIEEAPLVSSNIDPCRPLTSTSPSKKINSRRSKSGSPSNRK